MKKAKYFILQNFGLLFLFLILLFGQFTPQLASAALWEDQVGMGTKSTEVGYAYGERVSDRNDVVDVRIVVARIINIFLGFMGIVFLVLVVYGGFTWMTAAGQEDSITKAKKMLVAGVIGLIVVVASFAIAELVTDKIFSASLTMLDNSLDLL